MDNPNDFTIVRHRGHYVLANRKGKRCQHTHLKKKGTCHLLIKLICKKTVPDSSYLKESARRISRDEKYIRNIEVKQAKDNDKSHYTNINKGVVR